MRRLAPWPVAACALAALTACAGSGINGNNTNVTPTAIVFYNGSNQVNAFAVSASGSAPELVLAVAVHGSGGYTTIIPGVRFTWAATYATEGTPFNTGPSGNVVGTCGQPMQTTGINSLLQQGPTYVTHANPYPLPGYGGAYSQLDEQAGSNPPNYTQAASQIYVGPALVPIVGESDPSLYPSPSPIVGVLGTGTGYPSNYCIVVVAKAIPSGVIGSTLVVVAQ